MTGQYSRQEGNAKNAGCETVISFATVHKNIDLLRQTEFQSGHHAGVVFVPGFCAQADWLVIYDEFEEPTSTHLPVSRRILFLTEPPDLKTYNANFLNQFGCVVSPFAPPEFSGEWVQSHPGIPWWYGLNRPHGSQHSIELTYRELIEPPDTTGKVPRLSVVCSAASHSDRHRERMDFILALKAALPDMVDLYGTGFDPIDDKADAIRPYCYHLALENNLIPHFWTEKLADTYLGAAVPLYSGCPNIADYFCKSSLIALPDLRDKEGCINVIAAVLEANPYEKYLAPVLAARRKLIAEHNLPTMIARIVRDRSTPIADSGPAYQLLPSRQLETPRRRKTLLGYLSAKLTQIL